MNEYESTDVYERFDWVVQPHHLRIRRAAPAARPVPNVRINVEVDRVVARGETCRVFRAATGTGARPVERHDELVLAGREHVVGARAAERREMIRLMRRRRRCARRSETPSGFAGS